MSTTAFVPTARRRWIRSPDVSRSELIFFRLIERLSEGRAGCVLNFATLASMLGKCKRQAWTLFGRLVRAGWVAYRTYKKGGKSYFEFWPVVRVSERSKPVFERTPRLSACPEKMSACPEKLHSQASKTALSDTPKTALSDASDASFFAPKTALTTALSSGKNCTLVEGAYKTNITPEGGRQQTGTGLREASGESQTDPVAVSLLENVVSAHEAQELAREATRKQLTKEQIERVLEAYRGQIDNIRNRGAWLRRAIQNCYQPAAPAASHPSEAVSHDEVKQVWIPRDQPFWSGQTGQAGTQTSQKSARAGKEVVAEKPFEQGLSGLEKMRAEMQARRKGQSLGYSVPNTQGAA
jgi:hypothetical protein